MEPLTPERWAAIDTLFEQALDRPPDERTAFLRATCGDDPALYHAVTALLESDAAAEQALGESATAFASHLLDTAAAEHERDLALGTRVGPYRVEGELGRGGMGMVYRAARADGTFEKDVALKLVKRGMDTEEVLRRFRYERQILAGLDHPHIARLLDAGAADDGRPYLVMELVEGEPITKYASARSLDLEAQLGLFEQVCEAVAYAHRHLVVHRDLKPSNILVADSEHGEPQVKLLDFGIARLLDDEGADDPLTRAGQRVLTPEYAAPEQQRGEAATTATDVYALGVVLFELIAGRRPVHAGERPSDAAPPTLRRALRGDLDTLLGKALHEEAARRYPTAEALLEDLGRRRTGQPLRARPDSAAYRARKFLSRHRWGAGVAAAALIALIVFLGVLAVEQRETARERDKAQATADFLESLFAAADPFAAERQDTLRVRDMLGTGLERARLELNEEPVVQTQLLHVIGKVYKRLGLYAEAETALSEAVERRRGSGDPDLAASLVALSGVVRERGDFDRADTLSSEALTLAERTGDPPLLAAAEIERGLCLQDFGRHDEAESLHIAALERLRALHGEDHQDVASAEGLLARVLVNQGRLDEAEQHYRASIDRYGRVYGENHPARLSSLREFAFLLLAAGRLDEAEATAAEAVAIARATRPDGSSTGLTFSVYGMILRRQGKLDEAEAILRESTTLPPRRPEDRAVPLGVLASVLKEQGNLAGAEAAQREALSLLRDAHGADSPGAVSATIKLADILQQQRRFAEAERLLLDAQATPSPEAPSHHTTNRAVQALVGLYKAWGQPEEVARWQARLEATSD